MDLRPLADLIRGAGAMALDCDGVLVDVSASYDRAIALTVARLLGGLGVPARLDVDRPLVEGFKATGGFNDEVDLAYAATLCAAAAGASGRDARGPQGREPGRGPVRARPRRGCNLYMPSGGSPTAWLL